MNKEGRIDTFNSLFSPSFGCPADFEEGDEPLDYVCEDFIKGNYLIEIYFKGKFLLDVKIAKSEVYLNDLECIKKLIHSANNRNKEKGHDELYKPYDKNSRDEFILGLKPFPSECYWCKKQLTFQRFVLPNEVVKQIKHLCGVEVPLKYKEKFKYAPSIDRMDSDKPYSIDNIRIISWMMNDVKSNKNEQEMKEYISDFNF